MPGFGFDNDELSKLFAEAGAAVKKAHSEPSAPSQIAAQIAPEPAVPAPEPEAQLEEPAAPAPRPAPAPAAPPAGATQQVLGGSLDAAGAAVNHAGGGQSQVPWSAVSSLALGRLPEGSCLAFRCRDTIYYFLDSRLDYRGLLPELQPTSVMNWRALVGAFAANCGASADPGVQALTSGGGVVPKYGGLDDFLGKTGV